VFARAADDRLDLSHRSFVAVGNDAPLSGLVGRYLEVRVAFIRVSPADEPKLAELKIKFQPL